MKLPLISIYLSLVSVALGVKLPPSFMQCDVKQSDFQQCLTKAVESAIKQMNRPLKEVNLLNLEPLEIPAMTVAAGSQILYSQQVFKNMKVSGFNETTCSKVEFDSATKILKLDCTVPRFRLEFDYELNGRLFLVSLYGKGSGWAVFVGNRMTLTFKLGEYEKKGKKYYNVVKQELKMRMTDIEFDLQNLFDGDEEAADRVKKIIRENALEIFGDVKPGYEEAFGLIFASIFDRFLGKVPAAYLFGEK
ncbi:uncharacterized protein LOC135142650 [Zophobas morio]|uniref:uncharacterized protein LOC135142650 n=1 Tax=Zophobas morio TaxID=2755281 RepID=UPI0030836BCE